MSFARYSLIVLAVVAASLAALWPALAGARGPALLGAMLAAANTLLAYALAIWSEKRSTNVFLGAVLGGMVCRMVLMLAAVAGLVVYLGVPKVPLAVSLLSYFVLFLVLELATLQKRTSPRALAR